MLNLSRVAIAILTWIASTFLDAHEGHRPLPTRGMEVNVETGRMVLTKAARETLDVQTVESVSKQIAQSIYAYGTLVAPWNRHAVIASPLTGRITNLKVRPGETVAAGQVLAEMESPELQQLVLALRASQVDRLLSERMVENVRPAILSGAVPGVRLIEAISKLEQDSAAVKLASAKWRSLQLPSTMLEAILLEPRLDHQQLLELQSPIDGIVTHADLSIGKVVDPKEHLFEVLDLRKVWLQIHILEKDLAQIVVGQRVVLRLTALPEHPIVGTIDVVDSFLNPDTHFGTVWATLTNDMRGIVQLLPGMSGSVQVELQQSGERLVIPVSAVIRDGAERFVLVELEQTTVASTYQKQPLVLGKRDGDLIEVRGGNLYLGDRVVTRGSHELGSFFAKGVLTVSPETARDIGLTTQVVASHVVAETLAIDGIVDVPPTHRSVASAQMTGNIKSILVDRGQNVRRGDVLAEVSSQAFQNLQIDLLQANLNVKLRKTVVDNLRSANDAIAQRQLWENESQLNQFSSRRDALIQQLKTAGLTDAQIIDLANNQQIIDSLPVRAPIDGAIVGFDKFLGYVVRPDEPLFEVHDLSHAWVQGFISERDFSRVRIGQHVRMRFVTSPDIVVLGIVARSGQSVSNDDRTLSIWIELQDMPAFQLQHNMLARIHIETGDSSSGLAVPVEAIVREGTRAYVFVEGANKTFERRFVITGKANDLQVGILDGLSPGESIAVGGAAALQSGFAALK